MDQHPIEGLMNTAMNNIRDMIDVNTIIGEPIQCYENTIIPISKVKFGFASGGSEFNSEMVKDYRRVDKTEEINYKVPFGGGSGAGVTIVPIAFLVVGKESVKLLHVSPETSIDKVLDYIPDLIEKGSEFIKNNCKKETEE